MMHTTCPSYLSMDEQIKMIIVANPTLELQLSECQYKLISLEDKFGRIVQRNQFMDFSLLYFVYFSSVPKF